MGASSRPFILTSVGKKYIMALSGMVWAGFVFAHMAGNLLIFVGPDAYNKYGHALTSGYFIYAAETVLVLSLFTHIFCAVSLTRENRAARGGQRYAISPNGTKGTTLASRTMAIQGSIILVFLINHLITFKFGHIYIDQNSNMRDLYRLLIENFRKPEYVAWYVLSLTLLAGHLSHGIGSIFQSLGLRSDKYAGAFKKIGWVYAAVVVIGFLSQPIYIFITSRE